MGLTQSLGHCFAKIPTDAAARLDTRLESQSVLILIAELFCTKGGMEVKVTFGSSLSSK